MRIAVLLTCFNRKERTLTCLKALAQQKRAQGTLIDVYLVDDGCTDGTALAVETFDSSVVIIKGTGNLYWNGGMRLAFERALSKEYDFYLWLNDDTILYPETVELLLNTYSQVKSPGSSTSIIVGSTQDELTKKITYGGLVRPDWQRPTKFNIVTPSDTPLECETLNGNCVLIPNQAAQILGNLSADFVHAIGDLDYGLRAGKAGIKLFIMPGYAGTCSRNTIEGTFHDSDLPLSVRWQKIQAPNGLPIEPWKAFTRRHAGWLWPIYWLWPYCNLLISPLTAKSRSAK